MTTMTVYSTKNLRIGVTECLDEAIQLVHDVERAGRLFQAHTRWGKTLAIRLLAYCMNYGYVDPETGEMVSPTSSVHVLVTPGKHLVEQALDDKKWAKNLETYEMDAPVMRRCSIAATDNYRQISTNGERFFAVTIQQLMELDKSPLLRQWVEHVTWVYKRPPIFHFDEVHFNNEIKPWGELVVKVQGYGGKTIGWTATPQRADNGVIPGARVSVRGQTDGKETVLKGIRIDEHGERWAILEDRQVSVTDLIIHPDVTITFARGWNLKYILKVDPDFIDMALEQLNIDGSSEGAKMLSDLSASFIRKHGILRQVVEDPAFIRYCANAVARAFARYENPQVLIFSNADNKSTRGLDKHARLIKRIFQEEMPTLSMDIDTGNADDPGAAMKKFEDGGCDALVVKRMGAVGWDVPRIMIVVDLSVDRTAARCMQAWLRGATLNGSSVVFTLIMPQDELALDIFKSEIDREGGNAELKDIAPIGTREEPIQPDERPFFNMGEPEHGDFVDSDRNTASRDEKPIIDWFMKTFPTVSHYYTQPEIAGKIDGKFKVDGFPEDEPTERTDIRISDLQSTVSSNMDKYINGSGVYNSTTRCNSRNGLSWDDHIKQCWHTFRLRCGGYTRFPKDAKGDVVEIKKLRDIELLEEMKKQSTIMAETVRRENHKSTV